MFDVAQFEQCGNLKYVWATKTNMSQGDTERMKPYIPALLTSGLLPLMIAKRALSSSATQDARDSDRLQSVMKDMMKAHELTHEQNAALDRCSMYETAFNLHSTKPQRIVGDVRDYVRHLKSNHAHSGMHTHGQWKTLRRCMHAGSYCKKDFGSFLKYALQRALTSMRKDGTGVRYGSVQLGEGSPTITIIGMDSVSMPRMFYGSESSDDEETGDVSTSQWHEVTYEGDTDDESEGDAETESDEELLSLASSASPVSSRASTGFDKLLEALDEKSVKNDEDDPEDEHEDTVVEYEHSDSELVI